MARGRVPGWGHTLTMRSSYATAAPQRASISLVDAEVISQHAHPGQQYILRVHAPRCARDAEPGSFAHIACDPAIGMRRPLSIMRRNAAEGWVEFLYKPVGAGLLHLARHVPGDTVSLLGPIGRGFRLDPRRPRVIALGGGVGIPPMIFLAEELRDDTRFELTVFMGSELPFPFELVTPDRRPGGLPDSASGSLALLEDWGVPSHLASQAALPDCYPGYVTELARCWLAACPRSDRARLQVVSCGPLPMLEASARLAEDYELPCQVSMEEYMACGVGGCAGCTVLVHEPEGPAMRRVCVDGPVFDATWVFPPGLSAPARA